MARDLFIGITSFNSEWFLDACLDSLAKTLEKGSYRTMVLDNSSTDNSVRISKKWGAEVVIKNCTQANALNYLYRRSGSPYTLLIHADVVMLGKTWFEKCCAKVDAGSVLVSPEDIGLGPYTRGYPGMPESSFMFFDTARAKKICNWYRTQRFKVLWPWKGINFYGPHITHGLPADIHSAGLNWTPMRVLVSPRSQTPIYECDFEAANWRKEYGNYQYGFGNFYSLDGEITHYHNWYNRAEQVAPDSKEVHKSDLLPLAYLRIYGDRFLKDYFSGQLRLPEQQESNGTALASTCIKDPT